MSLGGESVLGRWNKWGQAFKIKFALKVKQAPISAFKLFSSSPPNCSLPCTTIRCCFAGQRKLRNDVF